MLITLHIHSKNKCVVKCVIFTHYTRCKVCIIERSVYLINIDKSIFRVQNVKVFEN